MRVLIIDDATLWINQGRKLLEPTGHEVSAVEVTDPHMFTTKELPKEVREKLEAADVLLVDKDIGEGITSTRLICVIRHNFPELPIIRWTGGYGRAHHMKLLKVSTLDKPTKKHEAGFVESFEAALAEQMALLFGPMGMFDHLKEVVKPDEHGAESRKKRLDQLRQIVGLAEADRVPSDNWEYPWMITGRSGGVTKHELGHAVCDGDLSADDLRPFMADLKKVIAKFEEAHEIDGRFQICAEFIKEGNLDELELVKGCY